MLATWELPASLSRYGAEGHISNEGEDIVKRIWDLFSEIGTNASNHMDREKGLPATREPGRDFDRCVLLVMCFLNKKECFDRCALFEQKECC